MVNEELEEAQRSVDKMDDEYKEAQQYIADSHGEGDPKEMFQTRMLMGQIDNRGASAVVYRDRLKKTKSSPVFRPHRLRPPGRGGKRCLLHRPVRLPLPAAAVRHRLALPGGQHVLRLRAGARLLRRPQGHTRAA